LAAVCTKNGLRTVAMGGGPDKDKRGKGRKGGKKKNHGQKLLSSDCHPCDSGKKRGKKGKLGAKLWFVVSKKGGIPFNCLTAHLPAGRQRWRGNRDSRHADFTEEDKKRKEKRERIQR